MPLPLGRTRGHLLSQSNTEKLDDRCPPQVWLTVVKAGMELVLLVSKGFGNGRRPMAALKCQKQGEHTLFGDSKPGIAEYLDLGMANK